MIICLPRVTRHRGKAAWPLHPWLHSAAHCGPNETPSANAAPFGPKDAFAKSASFSPSRRVLPITAGRLFDLTQGYGIAILIAAGGNALGILVALGLPHETAARE